MRAAHLQRSLDNLAAAMREVERDLAELRAMHDPLALHIFQSRREYRTMSDTKSGKRHALAARLSWRDACDHGYRGTLAEWTRLLCDFPLR